MSSVEVKQRKGRKGQKDVDPEVKQKLTKEEEVIAKYLRFSMPSRKGNLCGMKVDFFVGSKAVDFLMKSKWATGDKKTDILFANRQSCVSFMQRLLNKSLFHRAAKVYKEQQDMQAATSVSSSSKARESKTPESSPKQQKRKQLTTDGAEKSSDDNTSVNKKKFKLEMHDEQRFLDVNDAYVWIYDPTTTKTIVIGSLLVMASILICMFPLWPSNVREGVYYLSLGGAWFLGAILALAVFKYIIFAVLWCLTLGQLYFWLFPNLTEDVGFFESFWPIYKYNCSSNKKTDTKKAAEAVAAASTITTSTSNTAPILAENNLVQNASTEPVSQLIDEKLDDEIDDFEIIDNNEDEKKDA